MSSPGYRRTMTEADFDAENRVRLDRLARNDRIRDAIAAQTGEQPDPHVICFADGCASWQHFQYRADAESELARALAAGSPVWSGAYLRPMRREWTMHESGGRVYTDYDAETGAVLVGYQDCPVHNEDARAAAQAMREATS